MGVPEADLDAGISVDPDDQPGGGVGVGLAADADALVDIPEKERLRLDGADKGGGAKVDLDRDEEDEPPASGFIGGRERPALDRACAVARDAAPAPAPAAPADPVCDGVRVGVPASGVTDVFVRAEGSSNANGSKADDEDVLAAEAAAPRLLVSVGMTPVPVSCPLPTSVAKSTGP